MCANKIPLFTRKGVELDKGNLLRQFRCTRDKAHEIQLEVVQKLRVRLHHPKKQPRIDNAPVNQTHLLKIFQPRNSLRRTATCTLHIIL